MDPKEILKKNSHLVTPKGVKQALKLGVRVSVSGKRGNATGKRKAAKRVAAIKAMSFRDRLSMGAQKKTDKALRRTQLKRMY